MIWRIFLVGFAMLFAAPLSAQTADEPDAASILARATEAMGGEQWAKAESLILTGHAEFWDASGPAPARRAERYVMYRTFDPARSAAHGAEGKVRIIAEQEGRTLFTIGYDGATTWTEKGIVPAAQADAMWASNFGFGIIRHAMKPGFVAERVADRNVEGHALYIVRLTDPTGTVTLFGMDKGSYAVRYMGFMTPRGWHERIYDDFYHPPSAPQWLQAGRVTLYYNGVKQNTVYWTSAEVNAAIDPAVFVITKNE